MAKKYVYPAILKAEDQGYHVYCPDLPGCVTQGTDIADAIDAIRDAIGSWIFSARKHNDEIPAPSININIENDEILTLVDVDFDQYLRRNESAAVKKTLTIPSWLNELAEQEHINFSQTLQKALLDELGEFHSI